MSGPLRPNRAQSAWAVTALVLYAAGYPLALVGGSSVGWLLVSLGGVALLVLGALTVARVTGAGSPARPSTPPGDRVSPADPAAAAEADPGQVEQQP